LAHSFRAIVLGLWWGRASCGEQVVEQMAEREWQRGRGRGQDTAFKVIPGVTYFLHRGPTSWHFYHFPIMPSNYNSINGLIHWLGQSPQDLITSQKVISCESSSQNVSLWTFHIQAINNILSHSLIPCSLKELMISIRASPSLMVIYLTALKANIISIIRKHWC
jgi:hypothetical protein